MEIQHLDEEEDRLQEQDNFGCAEDSSSSTNRKDKSNVTFGTYSDEEKSVPNHKNEKQVK